MAFDIHDDGCCKDAAVMAQAPLCRFGVITDVQFCDIDPCAGWDKYVRQFRGSLTQLRDAVSWWNRACTGKLDFVVQGGDLIDSRCVGKCIVDQCITKALDVLKEVQVPVVHLVGNHEMVCMSRRKWRSEVATAHAPEPTLAQLASGVSYSRWRQEGIKVLFLDGFHEAMLGPCEDEVLLASAKHYFSTCKERQGFKDGQKTHLMHDCNGGLGAKQLEWFREELRQAAEEKDRVVVCCHQPLHPNASEGLSMVWDFQEALDAIYGRPGVVAAVIAGHYHFGGYHKDAQGVHHLTLQAPLVRGGNGSAYGTVEVFVDKLVVRGPRLVDLLSAEAFTGSRTAGFNDPPAAKGWLESDLDCEAWQVSLL